MPLFYTKRHTFSKNVIKTSLRKQLSADRDYYPQLTLMFIARQKPGHPPGRFFTGINKFMPRRATAHNPYYLPCIQ